MLKVIINDQMKSRCGLRREAQNKIISKIEIKAGGKPGETGESGWMDRWMDE